MISFRTNLTIQSPPINHTFQGGHDDFRCTRCHQPRCLHANDGFQPRPGLGLEKSSLQSAAQFIGSIPFQDRPHH